MKIGVVLHPYGEDKPSGLGHYIVELTQNLLLLDRENTYYIYTKGQPRVLPDLPGTNWQIIPLRFGKLWRDLGFFFAPRADVYLFVMPVLPLFLKLNKTITITHDFPYHYIPAQNLKQRVLYFFLHYIHKRSLRRADKVVAISQYTKNEDIKLFGTNPNKIQIIYNGYRNVCLTAPTDVDVPKPFFMTVGAVKERKNTLRLVMAFDQFRKKGNFAHKLVIVGKTSGPYAEKVRDYVAQNNLADQVIFFGHTKDPQLSYLYKNTEALVFPSTIESFGFPVLEAMSCGTPVITSNTGGVSEVVADAALKVNPENVSDIAGAMTRIATDPKLRADLVARGLRRAQDFSWPQTAQKFLNLIRDL